MTYEETLDYLYSRLPFFQRIGKAAYKADLSNTIALCKLLQNPEEAFPTVHVAGTNGKGSVSHMIASVLQEAGYKTGLYTSPHLADFRERIRMNGQLMPRQAVTDFVTAYKDGFEPLHTSFFELTVGMAFHHFREEKADIAVIEVGLGGRLDSTNVIGPEVSVITNISLDHTHLLGNTIAQIAAEKAGIIKENTPLVTGELHPEAAEVIRRRARALRATVHPADKALPDYTTDLHGSFQNINVQTALQAIRQLRLKHWHISDEHLRLGLRKVVSNTGLRGRWETLRTMPKTIADIGHNEAGIRAILGELEKEVFEQLHFVLGMVEDKEVERILPLLPKNALYYFCQAGIPRALNRDQLKEKASGYHIKGLSYVSVAAALSAANAAAAENDLILIGGSAFVVAEVL